MEALKTKSEALTANWLAFALCALSYGLGGTASTLMATVLPVAVPDVLGQSVSEERLGEIGAYISAAFLYGWMVGGLAFGVVGDRIGRVRAVAFVTALYGAAMLLTVFAPNWPVLLLCRFLTGAGVGGVLLLTTVYLSEIWPERGRAVVLGVLAVMFPVGIVATGGLNVGAVPWRQAFWLGAVPLVVAGLMLFRLPESASWQQASRKQSTTKFNDWTPTDRANLLTGVLVFGAVLIGLWGTFSWIPTWVQTLLPAGQTGERERGLTMMLLGMGGILGGMVSGGLLNRLGSRRTLLLTFAGCAGGCALLFLTNQTFSPVIYAETAFVALFFGISQGSLSSIIPALFPVRIRATAAGISFNIGRFFTATAVFFVGAMVAALGGFGNALLVFSVAFLVALLVVLARYKTD
ncbi:MFS transporter [Spirosoma montaniterrae]|uniref:MFS transporter n=1 Tax=Spirosoma montaniterrae TaxID=1178516 RepID=A0A1P9WYQ6_9BACT|nr:MFS transporter [Spirosoma montaniterrae]AQG80494.1 MFS transporter [Spirosoma montaniterrae]